MSFRTHIKTTLLVEQLKGNLLIRFLIN